MMWACLYDKNFKPLGNWTQHIVSEWSLTRKAFEFDELTLTCKGFENSKNACFIGLHDELGNLKYLSFCGIPTTKNGLTTIKGVDTRQLFNQKVMLDFSLKETGGSDFLIKDVRSLYKYLLEDNFSEDFNNINLGITYSLDLGDTYNVTNWEEDKISRTKELRSLYDQIQAVNNNYDCIVLAEPSVDINTNNYSLNFAVKKISKLVKIKLSDFDVKMSLSQNVTNQVICTNGQQTKKYYLYNDNTIGEEFNQEKLFMPPRIETIYKKPEDYEDQVEEAQDTADNLALKAACVEGIQTLQASRYKDKVSIDLNTKLGSTLQDVDLTYFADITEYNPADPDSTKRLPVMSIKEDSKGNKKIEFGRLSDYWFMED